MWLIRIKSGRVNERLNLLDHRRINGGVSVADADGEYTAKTIEEAVAQMADYQTGKRLSPADAKLIATFLKTLTGELPTEYIKQPKLPRSTPATPKPE